MCSMELWNDLDSRLFRVMFCFFSIGQASAQRGNQADSMRDIFRALGQGEKA